MSRTHHPNSNLISHILYNYITLIQSNTIASIQRIVMKRERENEEIESLNLANFLILYSQARESKLHKSLASDKVFQCKTCNREFSSFQALGGHRASHKKPKLDGDELKSEAKFLSLGNKPKMHECSICGLKFSQGQALGGHMRKHRDAWNQGFPSINEVVAKVPVLKICLDLNLTPLENDLKLLFDKMTPKVHLSLL